MPLQDSIRPGRASALRVELPAPHNREITFQPPSLKMGRECLALDPKAGAPPETPRERLDRLTRQATILFGPEHAHWVEVLTLDQCTEIVQALYLVSAGIDPADFLTVQKSLRDQRQSKRTSAEVLAQIETLTVELAADLKQLPSTVEAMPLLDAVNLRDRLAEHAAKEAKFYAVMLRTKLF